MYPILVSIGSVEIYSLSIVIVASWLIFSFLFWRSLRAGGVTEENIFDLTFYATLAAFIFARVGFIVSHWATFAGKSPLLMLAVWIAPGLSWFGALIAGVAMLVYLARRRKIRLGLVLDAIPIALGLSLILGKLGSLLDGAEIGKLSSVPWSIVVAGYEGARHPVQVYEMMVMVVILLVCVAMARRAQKAKWAFGLVGVRFFLLYSFTMFLLEFLKNSRVYWGGLNANQWVLIGIFAESVGVYYVRGGGRDSWRIRLRTVSHKVNALRAKIYAKFSKRHSH